MPAPALIPLTFMLRVRLTDAESDALHAHAAAMDASLSAVTLAALVEAVPGFPVRETPK